mmetsp:Transcript_32161/g.51824  ORF Transcript_32161/g.51824 Transcript_32161/m.51824 type:complete len:446 (+) Transcript_32161:326-1663(+)
MCRFAGASMQGRVCPSLCVFATMALLLAMPTTTVGRPCTVMPSTAVNSTNVSTTAVYNASNSTTNETTSTSAPAVTPTPKHKGQNAQEEDFQIQATPIASKLADQSAQITADLDSMNQTIQHMTRDRNFFPDVELNKDLESFVASCFLLIGLFCAVIGAQYAKLVFIVMSFIAGIVLSMYPIDNLMGDILCGPYPCSPDTPSEEFCGWAMAAGLVAGVMSASASVKLFDAGLVAVGAGMALLPALLLQPAFSRALRAKPVWTHYLHYVAFLGIGAGLAKKYPKVLLISISAVLGALLLGMSISYFIDAGLSPAAISGSEDNACTDSLCIGMACATGVCAVASAAFQTWYQKRVDKRESGQDIEEQLESTLQSQKRVLQTLESTNASMASNNAVFFSGTRRGEARYYADDLRSLEVEAQENMFRNSIKPERGSPAYRDNETLSRVI